jgi:histidyl-tRNA synthetase
MDEDRLDTLLAKEATRRGWAENKFEFAARILKHALSEIDDKNEKEMKSHFKSVIKYLEAYKFDD